MPHATPLPLETRHLLLIPMTHDFVNRLLAGDKNAYATLGVLPARGWPNADTLKILPAIRANLAKPDARPGFESWLFVHRTNRMPVGDGGFKGPPNEYGVVDLGYGILEAERQKGYCTEAARALIEWAFCQPGVKLITADCLDTNIASQNVLQKLGMQQYSQKNGLLFYKLVAQKKPSNTL